MILDSKLSTGTPSPEKLSVTIMFEHDLQNFQSAFLTIDGLIVTLIFDLLT